MEQISIMNRKMHKTKLSVISDTRCIVARFVLDHLHLYFGKLLTMCFLLLLMLLPGSVVAQSNTTFRTEAGVPYIPVLATAPTPTSEGAFYINSTDKLTYWYDGSKWIPLDLGVMADIVLSSNPVLYKGQTITPEVRYVYSGDKTSTSCTVTSASYKWYRADDAMGTNKTMLTSGTGTPSSYTVVTADVGKYIGLGITLTTSCNTTSFESISWRPVTTITPSVARVDIAGRTGTYVLKGNTLTASFSGYACTPVAIPGDVGAFSTYQWYYTDSPGLRQKAISGQTSATYTVNFSDGYTAGKYIVVGVTPVAANGNIGTEKLSPWYQAPALVPAYDMVNIVGLTSGKAKNSTTIAALKGIFSVTPAISGVEGTPTYQWYYATTATGTGKTAIVGQTGNTHTVNVGNYSYTNDSYYLAVGITPVTTTGETGTEVLSNWVQIQVDKAADGTTAVNEITSPSGRVWMDRNLGATQAAVGVTDYLAYGSLYQWGRGSDGHEKITWTSPTAGTPVNSTTSTLSTSTTPGHSMFITSTNSPYDWVSPQQNDGSIWWNGTAVGANNPCPTGFHVPTYAEWNAETPFITNNATAYSSLKLTLAGVRSYYNGTFTYTGQYGEYWCSSVNGSNAWRFFFYDSGVNMYSYERTYGFSVRCIKDLNAPQAQNVTVNGTPMPGSALTATYTYVPTQTTGSAEGTSTYKWYMASDGIGTGKTAIAEATAKSYTVASPVIVGKYIAVGVTPVSIDGKTGTEVLSTWVNVQSSPTVTAPDGTLVVDMTSSSGRVWMDRNLGASRAATSSTDYLAYGSLYQWCRPADGHERITWTSATAGAAVYGSTSTISTSTTPGHSLFITNSASPYDWLSTQQTDGSLWWNGSVTGANSPCPAGYHVPTYTEWNAELTAGMTTQALAYSRLKLPAAGYRHNSGGSPNYVGSYGCYWSSTVSSTYSSYLYFSSGIVSLSNYNDYNSRAYGMSVRCIKDLTTTAVVDIVSPSGRTWMDRNIGATQAATSSTDANSYGSLFQWSRAADGHEKINWTNATTGTPVNTVTVAGPVSTTSPGYSNFITNISTGTWTSVAQTDGALWWNGTVAGINTPCPSGYHVPTLTEWNVELSFLSSNNDAGAYGLLKLTMPGGRNFGTGDLYSTGTTGIYRSSTIDGGNNSRAWYVYFNSTTAAVGTHAQAYGLSVRCIKNLEVPQAQSVSISGTTSTGNTVTGTYTYISPQTNGKTEGTSAYRWYVATDAMGTGKTTVTGATAKNYTITSPVGAGKYIAFGVTPVSADGKTGVEVLSSWVWVASQITAYDGTVVNELVSPSGRVWMDRNLGANRAATSPTDYLAYGSLFQWARKPDGHEKITWTSATTGTPVNGTTGTLSSSTTPGHSLFITNNTGSSDWLSTQQSDGSLWWNGTIVGTNTPCPLGYHVPTYAEWNTELSYITSATTAFSVLKLPMSGYRWATDGTLNMAGTRGEYWSSTAINNVGWRLLYYDNSFNGMGNCVRAEGNGVRCIKDLTAPDGTLVVDMVSPSGRTWMDRNLGASRQATSSTDYLAYGSLYQWCRPADGHQKINWTSTTAGTPVNGTTTALSTTTTPGHSSFILNSTAPGDWLSNQQPDGSLWWSGATAGANTPCPVGYHVPTNLEWASELALFASNGGANATGAYNTLKLSVAGFRVASNGSFSSSGTTGNYWSTTVNGSNGYYLYINSGSTSIIGNAFRAAGGSIRCIKDIPLPVTTEVVELVSPSGRTWMDRNIGASRAASSSTDYQAYGSLFQWCRAADNHEKIIWTSATTGTPVYNTTTTLCTTNTPGHSLFIVNTTFPSNWVSTQQTDGMLWWNGIVSGANSPCPAGYHVPTYAEWSNELAGIPASAQDSWLYSRLKLPSVGWRDINNGLLALTGTRGAYWSSSVSGTDGYTMSFTSGSGLMQGNARGYGFSVRCIKNQTDIPKAQGVSVTGGVMMGATLTGNYTYVPPQISGSAEGTSTYKWYVATDASGTGSTAIGGATAKTYTVASPVATGKYVAFGVTPISSDGKTGSEVISSWMLVTPDGTVVVDMVSPSGRTWMDRNLGASQAAASSTDYLAYGSLFQWCRPADGHQLINWASSTTGTPVNGITSTLSSSTTPGHSLFIVNLSSPYDWLTTQQGSGSLWWNGTVAGANNPCPVGYHVPTSAEWNTELAQFSVNGGVNATGAYNTLKLPMPGLRSRVNGTLGSTTGSYGHYWSNTISGTNAYYFVFSSSSANMEGNERIWGVSVRCIKN